MNASGHDLSSARFARTITLSAELPVGVDETNVRFVGANVQHDGRDRLLRARSDNCLCLGYPSLSDWSGTMSIMKAVVVREAGGPEVLNLETKPVPAPKPGWVLISASLWSEPV
jgi:hypothetical protein